MRNLKRITVFLLLAILSITIIACEKTTESTNTTEDLSSISESISTSTSTTLESSSEFITATTSIAEYTSIELVENSQTFYELNAEFNKDSLNVIAHLSDGSFTSIAPDDLIIKNFNSTSSGEKNVYVVFEKFVLETNVIVLEDYAFEIYMDYYFEAINLKGDLLRITLNNIISENFIPLLYGDAIDILEESDVDPNNPDNVILVYPGDYGVSVPTGYSSQISGYYWNREHVWPQSRLGVNVSYTNDFPSKATDVHNLKPADGDENSSRSNDYFDNIDTDNTYEPNDNVKGDIARILFYMSTMYFDLNLNDNVNSASQDKTMGVLSVLLLWNELDPVDDFERNRNEVIFKHQGNRNPFIDYPEFANLIWGDLA
ncbi:MAG: endonuclease [Candidatus Izemoplasmatales bacterium]|nr:endonuclease [Candidatus Izemoplasmatales bacterium]